MLNYMRGVESELNSILMAPLGDDSEGGVTPPSGGRSGAITSDDGSGGGGGDQEDAKKWYGDVVVGDLPKNRRLPFPCKLYQLLHDVEKENDQHVVSWMPSGMSFKVHQKEVFVSKIMPVYFQQKSYKSFQRQLYLYGFDRILSGAAVAERGAYFHPQFVYGNRELTLEIKKVSKKQTQGRKNDAKTSSTRRYRHSSLPSSAATADLPRGFVEASFPQHQVQQNASRQTHEQQDQQHPMVAGSFPLHHDQSTTTTSMYPEVRGVPLHLSWQRKQPLQPLPRSNYTHAYPLLLGSQQPQPRQSQSYDMMEVRRNIARYQEQAANSGQGGAAPVRQYNIRSPTNFAGEPKPKHDDGHDGDGFVLDGGGIIQQDETTMLLPRTEEHDMQHKPPLFPPGMPPPDSAVLGACWSLAPTSSEQHEQQQQQHLNDTGAGAANHYSFVGGGRRGISSSGGYQHHHSYDHRHSSLKSLSAPTDDLSFSIPPHAEQQLQDASKSSGMLDSSRKNPPTTILRPDSSFPSCHQVVEASSPSLIYPQELQLTQQGQWLNESKTAAFEQASSRNNNSTVPHEERGHEDHHQHHTVSSTTDERARRGIITTKEETTRSSSFSAPSDDSSSPAPAEDWFSSIERYFGSKGHRE